MTESFDIIGDIHGHAKSLRALLAKLEYRHVDGVYSHSSRKAIFLGDLIDRGRGGQRETVEIVRSMVAAGNAHCVMGNHELNAIAYATEKPNAPGQYFRPHIDKNTRQQAAFLDEYAFGSDDYWDVINWFKTLPLWLEFDNLRIVHACWDKEVIARTRPKVSANNVADQALLIKATTPGCEEFVDIELLLKGKELALPQYSDAMVDAGGNSRREIRVMWHENKSTYRDAFLGGEAQRINVPDDPITTEDYVIDYAHDEPVVFVGHYWLDPGVPKRLAPNIACLDYSVVLPGGQLTAYRWDGGKTVENDRFVWVERVEVG